MVCMCLNCTGYRPNDLFPMLSGDITCVGNSFPILGGVIWVLYVPNVEWEYFDNLFPMMSGNDVLN